MKNERLFRAGIALAALFSSLFFHAETFAASFTNAARIPFSESAENLVFAQNERKIFDLVNRERDRFGLQNLVWNDDLARLARAYSEKMARENFFSHFEQDGADVAVRARASRIKGWSKIGENLFFCVGFREYDRFAVQNWMKSETHRRNILDEEYTASGVGLARSGNGKIYVTQVFIED